MLDGLDKYIRQTIKNPIYSEVYWEQAVFGTGILDKSWPLSEKVKGIYTNSIFISTSAGAGVVLRDSYGRILFENAIGVPFTMLEPFWYFFPGNQIRFTAAPGGVFRYSVSYQLITEHELNRGGQ